MAKNENDSRMRDNSIKQNLDDAVSIEMLELQRRERRRELDRQINTLAERAMAFQDMYGDEDYRTQIMIMFLDVTLQMKSVIDLLNDVGVALQCIGQAIGCIDDVLNMQQEMLTASLEQKYGLFERIKRRRRLRKAIRNNTSRMQQMCDMLVGSQKMAMSVISALRKSLVKMKATADRNFAKQKKREEKQRGNSKPREEQPSLAKKLLDEMRARDGGTEKVSGNGGSASTAPSADGGNGGNGGSSSGGDDIIDTSIL